MKKRIIQLAHVTNTPGPVQTLAEFLEKNNKNRVKKYWFNLENGYLGYLSDFGKAYRKIKKEKKIDIAIGMNCFDTLPLILLRKNRIKKVVLFGTDFSRKRYHSPILNWLYVAIDKYCAKRSDFVCGNSQRAVKQRLAEGVDKDKIIYVPNGIFLEKVKFKKKINFEKKLLFIGHVTKEHGLSELIKAVAKNKLYLEIIGDGPDLKLLKKKYFKDKKIKFLGRRSHDEVLEYLAKFNGFGVAPYVLDSDWTYYCDPVKIKEYLAFEIPVIISDIPEISGKIKKEHWGHVFGNKKELEQILKQVKVMKNDDYQLIIKKISKLRKNFDLNRIYKNMFEIIVSKDSD